MKVCFITFEYPPNTIGGAGTYAELLVKGLRRNGVDVSVITIGEGNDYDQKIFRVPTSDSRYWRRLFFMRPAMTLFHDLNELLKFDIVHFNEPHILLGKPDLPTVCTFHSIRANEMMQTSRHVNGAKFGDLVLKNTIGSVCDVLTAQICDKIICAPPYLARLVKSYCLVEEEKVCVIPNGIDPEAFDKIGYDGTEVLSEYSLERDNYILFIGRLTSLKGVQYLIEAFRRIKKDYPGVKLAIVGTGDFEYDLKNLANGVSDVVFTGNIAPLKIRKLLYENSLAVVVPSLSEGMPMVVLEAMTSRKAVIASDVGDIPLLVKHNETGLLAKPGDSSALEESIRMLLGDAGLRSRMGSHGRELVEKEFTVDKMAHETLRLYDLLVSAAGDFSSTRRHSRWQRGIAR